MSSVLTYEGLTEGSGQVLFFNFDFIHFYICTTVAARKREFNLGKKQGEN